MLRIPAKSPQCRRIGFQNAALPSTCCCIVAVSALSGVPEAAIFYTWWSPFRVTTLGITGMVLLTSLAVIDDAVAGPMDGRDTIPFLSSRPVAIVAALAIFDCRDFPTLQGSLPLLHDRDLFEAGTHAFHQEVHQGAAIAGGASIPFAIGLSSFCATLNFERKIDNFTSGALTFATFVFLAFDTSKLLLHCCLSPELSRPVSEAMECCNDVTNQCHLVEVSVGLVALTVANVVRKSVSVKGAESKQEA